MLVDGSDENGKMDISGCWCIWGVSQRVESTFHSPRSCVGKRCISCIEIFTFWIVYRSHVCQLIGECMYKKLMKCLKIMNAC